MTVRCGNCKKNHRDRKEVQACYAGKTVPESVLGRVERISGMLDEVITKDYGPEQHTVPAEHVKPARTPIPEHLRKDAAPTANEVPVVGFDEANLPGPEVMDGRYAVILDGRQTTLRFHVPTMGKWKGTQLVEYLYGPDNTMQGNWQRIGNRLEKGFRIWARYTKSDRLLDAVRFMMGASKEDLVSCGEAYALASSNCWRCGKDLTVEASIRRGLGPICADKVGV
jgi:hypothetical protein